MVASTGKLEGASKALTEQDGPLVWIDCEMTGLDYKKDVIIEIAVLITDGNLEIVDEGLEFVIKTDKRALDDMGPWCKEHHGKSGLTQACIDSTHTYEAVYQAVLDYVKTWIPKKGIAVLAGNSVHADKMFLAEGMPDLVEHLHYRIVDVSTIKELCHRWYPGVWMRGGKGSHRALDDIRDSIKELQFYRKTIFKPSDGDK